MSIVHVHLVLLHFPIALLIVGALLRLASLGGGDGFRVAARTCLILGGLAAVGTAFTGQAAEEVVEHALPAAEETLEAHEEVGMWAAYLAAAVVLAELVTVRVRRGPLAWLAAVLALATAGLTAYAGLTGGRIRHDQPFESVGASGPTASALAASLAPGAGLPAERAADP
jgi:uncharacterized membrane protein